MTHCGHVSEFNHFRSQSTQFRVDDTTQCGGGNTSVFGPEPPSNSPPPQLFILNTKLSPKG